MPNLDSPAKFRAKTKKKNRGLKVYSPRIVCVLSFFFFIFNILLFFVSSVRLFSSSLFSETRRKRLKVGRRSLANNQTGRSSGRYIYSTKPLKESKEAVNDSVACDDRNQKGNIVAHTRIFLGLFFSLSSFDEKKKPNK